MEGPNDHHNSNNNKRTPEVNRIRRAAHETAGHEIEEKGFLVA
jgi:hypothetical protein